MNRLTVGCYCNSVASLSNISGWVTLVYESDKSSLGLKAHVRSIPKVAYSQTGAGAVAVSNTTSAFDFLDTDYFVIGAGFECFRAETASNYTGYFASVAGASDELDGVGMYPQNLLYTRSEGENALNVCVLTVNPCQWIRWASDPESTRLDLKQSRALAFGTFAFVSHHNVTSWVCYHGHKKAITGTVSGSGSGTVNISAWSRLWKCSIGSTSRSGNGSYSIPWYDDTSADIFVEAREGASYLGRSDDTQAA
jgi:hypothetical protein